MTPSALNLCSTTELGDILFHEMSDGVLVVDHQGIIVDCNPSFYQKLGFAKAEMIGRSVRSLDTPEFASRVGERIAEIVKNGHATFDTAHIRKDGSIMSVELNARLFEVEGKTFVFSVVRDISERMALEDRLQKNLEIYTAAINTPALGFWVVSPDGRFLEVNDTYVKQSGYSREELLHMSVPDVEAMEKPAETAAHMEALTKAGFGRFRSAHKRKDGSVWAVEIVTTVSQLQGGFFVVFIEDIEEKVAQERRLEQAARVFEVMDQAVVVSDADNKIVSINPATTAITGYTFDDLRGKDPKIFASGRHDKDFFQDMWKAFDNDGHWVGEIEDRRKNGDIYKKQLTIHVIKDAQGAVSQYVSVFSDISVRKKVEEDLRRAHDELEDRVKERTKALTAEIQCRQKSEIELRKLTRAVEQSAHMVFITDIDGIIEYINPKFTEWMGYSTDEAIGKKPSLIKSGDTPQDVYAELWQKILSGQEWHGEIKDRRKNGQIFWASAAIAPVRDDTDNITHFIAIHEDITHRKEAEQAMQAARHVAEVANKAKTDLMANMSHELRTPLNAIIGFSETMTNSIFGPLGCDKYEEYAEYIYTSGSHLLQLINDILDVSSVEAGKLQLHEQETDIAEVCAAAIRIIQPRAKEGYVTVSCLKNTDLPPLWCDELRLKQIFINLLSNSVKFTPEKGLVTCDAYLDEGRNMVIVVADNGIGMNEDGMAKALDKFGQVDSSLSRTHEGTGLGLPLTKGLIELHGGTFELASELGRGTKITMRFPTERVRF